MAREKTTQVQPLLVRFDADAKRAIARRAKRNKEAQADFVRRWAERGVQQEDARDERRAAARAIAAASPAPPPEPTDRAA